MIRWKCGRKEYEEKLLNEENKWSGDANVEKNKGPREKVPVKAVTEALNLMKIMKTIVYGFGRFGKSN